MSWRAGCLGRVHAEAFSGEEGEEEPASSLNVRGDPARHPKPTATYLRFKTLVVRVKTQKLYEGPMSLWGGSLSLSIHTYIYIYKVSFLDRALRLSWTCLAAQTRSLLALWVGWKRAHFPGGPLFWCFPCLVDHQAGGLFEPRFFGSIGGRV